MTKPRDQPGSRFAELALLLPGSWIVDSRVWQDERRWAWPVHELRRAARLPHRFKTWLAIGHTMADDRPGSFDPSTRLSSLLVTTLSSLPEAIDTIDVGELQVDLLTIRPLYPEELEHALSHGAHDLIHRFARAGVGDVLDPVRASVVPS